MTNRETLSEMDDEELSDWLCGLMGRYGCTEDCPGFSRCSPHRTGLLEWLGEEVEEE